jgi:hypothetical protein
MLNNAWTCNKLKIYICSKNYNKHFKDGLSPSNCFKLNHAFGQYSMVSTNRLLFFIYYPLSFILKFKNNSDLDINITANISYIICAVEKKKPAGIVS